MFNFFRRKKKNKNDKPENWIEFSLESYQKSNKGIRRLKKLVQFKALFSRLKLRPRKPKVPALGEFFEWSTYFLIFIGFVSMLFLAVQIFKTQTDYVTEVKTQVEGVATGGSDANGLFGDPVQACGFKHVPDQTAKKSECAKVLECQVSETKWALVRSKDECLKAQKEATGSPTQSTNPTPTPAPSDEPSPTPPTDEPTQPSPTPAPTVNLKIDGVDGPLAVDSGSSHTLSWTSENAGNCSPSGGSWSGSLSTNGEQSVVVSSADTYKITCTSASTSDTASDTVDVTIN